MMAAPIYYHFLSSEHAIYDLEHRVIKVSLLDALNDPFELMPYLRYKNSKRRRRIKSAHAAFAEKYGLLCLSGNWREPLLWAHYAEKHKGVALGFEIVCGQVIRVSYSPSIIRKEIELTGNPEENERLFIQLANTKYYKWEYEDEYRVLVALEDCVEIDGHQFLRLDGRLKVKEMVLGCRWGKDWEHILRLARLSAARVIPTRMEWQGYRIRQCGTSKKRLEKKKASLGFE